MNVTATSNHPVTINLKIPINSVSNDTQNLNPTNKFQTTLQPRTHMQTACLCPRTDNTAANKQMDQSIQASNETVEI